MAKDLTVVVAATGDRKDITIEPGTTAEDVLRKLGLQGYTLSKDGTSTTFLLPGENLYPVVEDGAKLWASTKPEVGGVEGSGPPTSFSYPSERA